MVSLFSLLYIVFWREVTMISSKHPLTTFQEVFPNFCLIVKTTTQSPYLLQFLQFLPMEVNLLSSKRSLDLQIQSLYLFQFLQFQLKEVNLLPRKTAKPLAKKADHLSCFLYQLCAILRVLRYFI